MTPWHLDYAAVEEDIFVLCGFSAAGTAAGSLTVEGCRILARQFREMVEVRQARAAAMLIGQSLGLAPFDLHALLPVPDAEILQLGPYPSSRPLAWLSAHWGITGHGCARSPVRD